MKRLTLRAAWRHLWGEFPHGEREEPVSAAVGVVGGECSCADCGSIRYSRYCGICGADSQRLDVEAMDVRNRFGVCSGWRGSKWEAIAWCQPVAGSLPRADALLFAALIAVAADPGGRDFARLLERVRRT